MNTIQVLNLYPLYKTAHIRFIHAGIETLVLYQSSPAHKDINIHFTCSSLAQIYKKCTACFNMHLQDTEKGLHFLLVFPFIAFQSDLTICVICECSLISCLHMTLILMRASQRTSADPLFQPFCCISCSKPKIRNMHSRVLMAVQSSNISPAVPVAIACMNTLTSELTSLPLCVHVS